MSSHYAVLGLQPAMLDGSVSAATATALVRQAYRRALLRYHPDKQNPSRAQTDAPTHRPSVDEITQAWTVLSSPARRRAYDRDRAAQAQAQGHQGVPGASETGALASTGTMATGMETIDLDDLAWDADAGQWFRGCRCGNGRGFVFGEPDLEDEVAAAAAAAEEQRIQPQTTGELLVGCQDCSLWLCVHFAVVDEG